MEIRRRTHEHRRADGDRQRAPRCSCQLMHQRARRSRHSLVQSEKPGRRQQPHHARSVRVRGLQHTRDRAQRRRHQRQHAEEQDDECRLKREGHDHAHAARQDG